MQRNQEIREWEGTGVERKQLHSEPLFGLQFQDTEHVFI